MCLPSLPLAMGPFPVTHDMAGTIEIRLWILSWGADIEVVEPADLRADVLATLRAAEDLYRK